MSSKTHLANLCSENVGKVTTLTFEQGSSLITCIYCCMSFLIAYKYSLGFKTKYYEQVQSKITRKNERG